jgi:hypothetical protein
MSNLRIVETNVADQATLTASPALAASLPVTHLQDRRRAYVARTTSTASQTILGTWPALRWLSAAALCRHNLSPTATWRLELFDGVNQTGTTVYDSGAVAAVGTIPLGELDWGASPFGATWRLGHSQPLQSVLWFTPVEARSLRITLADASNPDGYMQASRLVMGTYWELENNVDYGAALAWVDNSELSRTAGGTLRNNPVEMYRELTLPFSWLTQADRGRMVDLLRRSGRSGEILVSMYAAEGGKLERDHTLLGRLVGGHQSAARTFLHYSDRLIVQET